jgi:hypothetical protein
MPEQAADSHQFTDQTSFYTGEGIVLLGDVTWPGSDEYGGAHQTEWQLFKDGKLVIERTAEENLRRKPADIVAHISAGSLSAGQYHAALQVDNKALLEKDFHIFASHDPAPIGTVIGPDCQGAPPPSVRPIHFPFPLYLVAVLHPKWRWCAVVSTTLDDAGNPEGIRVDAENPKGYGWGDVVFSSAWGATYPPGHGGQTTVTTYVFGPSTK